MYHLSLSLAQCHGLWDEDDPKMSQKDACLHEDEPVDEGKMAVEIPAEEEKSFPAYSLKSMNLGMSMDSSQVLMQVRYPEHRPHLRRQSTSGGSHLSRRSSVRSKRGEI